MSLHSSLKTKSGALRQHRNVLTRAERVEFLKAKGEFADDATPLGLIKVGNRKVSAGKKKKKKIDGEEGEEGAETGSSDTE